MSDITISSKSLVDDQTLFWNYIRKTHDPEIRPVGECSTAVYNVSNFTANQLPTCFLDSCMFSMGMVSTVLVFPNRPWTQIRSDLHYGEYRKRLLFSRPNHSDIYL